MSAKVAVETMVTVDDRLGVAAEIGWRTDSVSSRYWAGRRWSELTGRGQTARLVETRTGRLLQYGA